MTRQLLWFARDADVKPFYENKEEITKPAVIITASTFSFAREHFIGPLNRHLDRVIRGREVSAAFMMQAKPDRFLRQPLDVPEKQAVLAATIFFTQSFETLVGVLHGQTTIEKAVLIPLALDLFVNYSEYKTTFQAWRQHEIPLAYRTMQEDVRLMRVQLMLREEGTPMRAVIENHIAYITNHIATLEREYPDLVGHIDPNELQDGGANNLIAYN